MVVCVEYLPADSKPWDVESAIRRSSGSGMAPRACIYIHIYIIYIYICI